jgi:hypothetical protein
LALKVEKKEELYLKDHEEVLNNEEFAIENSRTGDEEGLKKEKAQSIISVCAD